MKETIKKALIFGLVSSFTMILVGITYAAVYNSVNSGDSLTASMWNNIHNYSETEVNTGKKWIDGSDIFRKVYNIGIISNDDLIDTLVNITPIGNWFNASGIYYNNTINHSSGTSLGFRYDPSTGKLSARQSGWSNGTFTSATFIFEYIKN